MLNTLSIDFSDLINKHKIILSIIDKNNDGKAKFVGGCVRDYIVYQTISNDIDISTVLEPSEVVEAVLKYKRKNKHVNCLVINKDAKYGTIIVVLNNQKYEITTTRSDIECFGRQANVEFCKDFYIDSLRRDFTFNAFYVGLDNKLLDFHGGIDDLNNGIVRFIGDTESRIKEDYLRIVRFFRFSTKFKITIADDEVLNVLKINKNGLLKISRERIRSEIFKMLEYDNWFFGLYVIINNGFVKEVFLLDSNIRINKIVPLFTSSNEIIKLFYFFNYDFNVIGRLKETLRFTKKEVKFVIFLMELWKKTNYGTNFSIDAKMLVFYDREGFVNHVLCLVNNNIKDEIQLFLKKKKHLPITAKELIDKGFYGKDLGNIIKKLELEFVKSDFELTNEDMLKFIS